MYSLDKYNKDNILLAKSIVVKLTDIAIAINKGLVKQYGMKIPYDRRQWKYYMNIAGMKHETNNDVYVNILELGEKKLLTKELLETYTYTKSELLKYSTTFDNLIDEYPDDIMFIKGCLHPVDINEAVSAKEGTILSWNDTFIEAAEFSMMRELQVHVYDFLSRWHIKEYTLVDDLYLPTMLANLYNSIVLKLINIRLEKIHTNEAHSFHLEHYFRSNFNLWTSVAIVNDSTKYWLYKNLGWIIRNIGRNEGLNKVIKNILNTNNVGLGSYLLRKTNVAPNTETGLYQPTFKAQDLVFNNTALNSYYNVSKNSSVSLETVIAKELNLENLDEDEIEEQTKFRNTHITNEAKDSVNNTYRDNQTTKILEISTYQLFKRHGVDLFKLLLDYMLYLIQEKKIQFLVEYIEPNDNRNYILTAENAVLFVLKLLLSITNSTHVKIKKITYDYILLKNKEDIKEAYKRQFRDGITDLYLDELIDNYPNIGKYCNTSNDVKILMDEIQKFFTFIWALDSNVESSIVSSNIKQLCNYITTSGDYVLTDNPEGLTIDELLKEAGLNYIITNTFDLTLSLQELIKLFTGVNIDESAIIKEITLGFKSLLAKLTSYSTQVMNMDIGDESVYLHYNNLNIFNSKYGVADITDGASKGLEEDYTHIESLANNFSDDCKGYTKHNYNLLAITPPKKPILGHMDLKDNRAIVTTSPNFGVEIFNTNKYGINRVEFKQEFLKDVDISMNPIEVFESELSSGGNTIMDNGPTNTYVESNSIVIDAVGGGLPDTPIKGVMHTQAYSDFTNPSLQVSIDQGDTPSITKGDYKNIFITDVSIDIESMETDDVVIESGSNYNKEADITYNEVYDNPININSQKAYLRSKPIIGYMDNKNNEDSSILNPSMQISVVEDPSVSITNIKDKDKFLLYVDGDLEANEPIAPTIAGVSNLNNEDIATKATYSDNAVLNAEVGELPSTPITGIATIKETANYTIPSIDVTIGQDPKVSIDKGTYENKFLLDVNMDLEPIDTEDVVIDSVALIKNTEVNIYNSIGIESQDADRKKPIDGFADVKENEDISVTEPNIIAELLPDPVVKVVSSDRDDYDDLEEDEDLLTPMK